MVLGALPNVGTGVEVIALDYYIGRSAEVRAAAEATLSAFPAQELAPVLRSKETPPAVLSWAVARRPERELREITLRSFPQLGPNARLVELPDLDFEVLTLNAPQIAAEPRSQMSSRCR